MLSGLPQGWVECKLGDVLYLQNGYAFNSKDYSSEGVSIVRISDIQNGRVLLDKSVKYNKSLVDECFEVKKGDFLIAMSGATTGKTGVYIENEIAYLNQRVGNLKIYCKDVLFHKYRDFFISNKRREIEKRAYGGAQPNISKHMIEDIDLFLPPLNEQRRIVEKIESEFAKIDEGLEHLENAKEQIKQYRQSVLKSAFEGKLYKTSEWKETTLNDCTSKLGDGLHGTPKYSDDGDFYFINGNNLNDGIIEIKKDTKKVNFEEYQKYKKELNNNTVLVSINGTIGNTAFYNNEKVILGKSACYFNLINNVDKYFIRYLLKTNYFLNYANKNATGSTIKNVSLKIMREFKFKLPLTLDEQKKIVEEIDKRFAVADEVEKVVEDNIEKAKQLKQSILKKAFEGRLVPQDPNDKPATILLEKIKQERSKNAK